MVRCHFWQFLGFLGVVPLGFGYPKTHELLPEASPDNRMVGIPPGEERACNLIYLILGASRVPLKILPSTPIEQNVHWAFTETGKLFV